MINFAILLTCLFSFSGFAQAQTFQSTNTRTHLLELYSSQGCSSCPPAERWVSKLINHPQLWQQFIPIVFHVDYWDYLGWKDPFSSKQFSMRQRNYHYQGAVSSVYTPGIILDGHEWRGWFRGKPMPDITSKAGILSATLNEGNLKVLYDSKVPLKLNVALLGFGIETNIQDGENAGRTFHEDFIVLNKQTIFSKNGMWNLPVQTTSHFKAQRYALVMWVNSAESLQPLQATGDWLEN